MSDPVQDQRLRVLVDHLPALVGYWDRDQRNLLANRAHEEWFDLTPDQIAGSHLRSVLGEDLYREHRPHVEAALAGEERHVETSLVDAAGVARHTQSSYVPDVVDGTVRGFYVLVGDVTPQVEAQQALVEAQELAGVGSWEFRVATGETTWSRQMYRIAGVEPEEFRPTAESVVALLHPDDRESVQSFLTHVQQLGRTYELFYRLVRPDGAVRELHARGRADRAPDGTVTRLSGTWQDVTSQNEHARDLARLNAELTRANRLNSDVLGMLGHDIRQPLAIMMGFLDVLTSRWERTAEDERRDYVARALAAARRTASLFDDVLSLVGAEAGEISSWPQPVDVTQAAHEAIDSDARRTPAEVRSVDRPWALVDPFQLQQVLTNLLSNADRYGGPPVVVDVSRRDDQVLIQVTDHGPGVPEAFVDHLFDRFAKAETETASESPGTGFGLYLVRRLVETNAGSIAYEPVEPQGSRFRVLLPAASPEPPDASGSPPGRD